MRAATLRERVRASLADERLQVALDNNAARRIKGRAGAYASLPDWRERRQRAHAIRADVISRLDEYLNSFIQQAQQNGLLIHRADDAAAAIAMVLDIVRKSPSRQRAGDKNLPVHLRSSPVNGPLIAKSKSMVSEEINLNHALEAEGIRVIETDLGEYIVQLRGERPSHIITPAVHLRRQDVGLLFHEKLGIPYTEDVPTLTRTAREVMREVFLRADVGLSGVNFGVAATGTLCIVSNEGNARMVTTLPPVHIALMGMERLVPSLDDLALLLSLLARSATGQKLSAYTQLIRRPQQGQERHVIILDNGRSALRSSPLAESLYCIRCGACLNACPIFRELGGHAYDSVYPGPIGSVISAGFFGPDFVPLAQASTLCGACKGACPVDIDLPKLLIRVRSGLSPAPISLGRIRRAPPSLSSSARLFLQVYSRLARSPQLFTLAQRLAALGTRLLSARGDWVRLPAFTGWGYSKDLPRFADMPFRRRFQRAEAAALSRSPDPERSEGEGAANGKDAKAIDYKLLQTEEPPGPRPSAAEANRLQQFVEELTAVNGQVTHTTQARLTGQIIAFLKSRGVDRIHLEPGVLEESALLDDDIRVSTAPDPSIRVGVTSAVCGLADTGSILITDGEGSPLHASLLPEVHLAVLQSSDILPTLGDALALPRLQASASAVVITGPSRTGDIEMTHTIGVHGPAELHVFLVG